MVMFLSSLITVVALGVPIGLIIKRKSIAKLQHQARFFGIVAIVWVLARRHPLAPGAAPADIRAGLLVEDRAGFDAAYAEALEAARESLDLTELFETLEHWRRVAALQSDRADFIRMARQAAELLTGEPVPEDEPLAVTRAKAGL